MKPGRIFVTGARGCIGSELVPLLLADGWEVHAGASSSAPQGPRGVTWHEGNLLEPGLAARLMADARPDVLVHLAWYIAPGKWAAAPENVDWVRASLELAQAFARSGGRRLVVAGSCLEYDWNYGYCSEVRTPCVPHTLYGASKNALRLVLEPFAQACGVSLAWGRAFMLYGPREHPDRLVAAVSRALLRGEPARVSHGRQVRDYLHVEDVARAFLTLVNSDVAGPVNVASGTPVTLRHIVERLGALTGRDDLLQINAIPAAPTDTALVVADVTRLRNELGWVQTVALDDGLRRTLDWWREQLGKEAA